MSEISRPVRVDKPFSDVFEAALKHYEGRDQRIALSEVLFRTIKRRMPDIEALLAKVRVGWGYEDPIYRYYHHSFKVYHVQYLTAEIVKLLEELRPEPNEPLNSLFMAIIGEGTNKTWNHEHNQAWSYHTRPMVEAFFHARHVLEMMAKYGKELDEPPQMLPSGWATVLYIYNLR